jgi:hypothetical protein
LIWLGIKFPAWLATMPGNINGLGRDAKGACAGKRTLLQEENKRSAAGLDKTTANLLTS